ncbi:uncharacterized protein LOC113236731 [Hyposmocoma kahamanoa]|uniref:uncharacterized protein LOC113236731 n=1 Tax=Hyposmocoma kahamanoa TaxID=1477025 RepID=UPI000E6D6C0F|nr:uncharacterized protein LOC113236731 [Hyposmocoma kahamanoa]
MGNFEWVIKGYMRVMILNYIGVNERLVMCNRLTRSLNENQPPEQAGFRSGYSTMDIHAVKQLMERYREYDRPLCLAYVDYEKAFDSVEHTRRLQEVFSWDGPGLENWKTSLHSKIRQSLKTKVYDQCVLLIFTYDTETWPLTKENMHKIKVAQRAMERTMLGVSLVDRIPNVEIR